MEPAGILISGHHLPIAIDQMLSESDTAVSVASGTTLRHVLINGQPISAIKASGELAFSHCHELFNLIGARGWKLVCSVLRRFDERGQGRSCSLIFKRRCKTA